MSAAEAEELFKKASGKIGNFFFNDEEAAFDLFVRAGAAFKVAKNFNRAGDSFMRAGDMAVKLKNPGDACIAFTDAAKAYQKGDPSKAAVAIEMACKLNIDNNRLASAAKLLKDYADALEADGHGDQALVHYKKASDYFRAEDQPSQANGCLVKMGKILGEADRYAEAAVIYEKLGHAYAEGALKHQAKEQFFRAFLCRAAEIVPDNVTEKAAEASDSLQSYVAADLYLRNTRELEAMEGILHAVEDRDEMKFDEVVASLDEIKMVDDWKAHVLLAIKKNLTSAL